MKERVVVSGSRGWRDVATIAKRLGELPDDAIVIHGGAEGADQLANKVCELRGLHTAIVYPRWKDYGKRAGHIRNAKMLDLDPTRLIAFSLGTSGTQGIIDDARRRGIPVEVVGVEAA